MNQQLKASVIILDYFKADKVLENVESLLAQEVDFEYEVIIIDNSVNEANAQKLIKLNENPKVSVIINRENTGYINGNNLGASKASGKYLLIVNPDIQWGESSNFQQLIDYMEKNDSIGILGPKQINETDGEIAMTVRAFPRFFTQIARRTRLRHLPVIKKLVAYDEMQHLDHEITQSVDWLQSSFWVLPKALWDSFGGLNTDYFIFMADPDMCFKVWQKGYRVAYYPKVSVFADGKRASEGSGMDIFKKWILRQHLKDSLKYCFNHFLKKNPRK